MVRLMLVLGLVLSLAACSGGTDGLSKSEEADLQDRLEAAEAARIKAEEAKDIAEEEKAKAEEEKAKAEEAKDIAEEEQGRQRQAAETARLAAEAAKREQDRLKAEVEEATLKALQVEASIALRGLRGPPDGPEFLPTLTNTNVTPQYRAPALVTTPASNAVTFTSPRGSLAGEWYSTTSSNRGATYQDEMVVYSDVGGGESTAIDEAYENFDAIMDTSLVEIDIANDDHKGLVRSPRFPRTASTIEIDPTEVSEPDDNPLTMDTKDMVRFSGTFARANGEFRCIVSGNDPCTVQYTGENYLLGGGTWTFRTSKNSKVTVPDDQHMYFGWWRRQEISNGVFSYGAFSGTQGPTLSGQGFIGLEGTAVYEGPAIGQYAIYAPLSPVSNHGSFNARARLTANFGDAVESGNISGSITRFDANPGWAVTLKGSSIANDGTIADGEVSWMIDGNTEDGGVWKSEFHADLETYIDTYPDGVTGTFEATYSTVGRMMGAFGAKN